MGGRRLRSIRVSGRMWWEAVEKYQSERPDVVLLDITMPDMDGLEALKQIIELDKNAKIAMVTAIGQQNMVIECLKSGAKDFVVKPFDPARVLEAVKKMVG
jgi:two-component system chemotaxis response regulator CheY